MQTVTSKDGTVGPGRPPVPADNAERVGRLVAQGRRDQAVVVGEGSEAFFHDGARALVELLPRASYRVLPGQDHSAFWMAPDAVAASVAGFLQATAY